MELTIEQALQKGVAAHNSGNLQEAIYIDCQVPLAITQIPLNVAPL
jgi:hypothetical protein